MPEQELVISGFSGDYPRVIYVENFDTIDILDTKGDSVKQSLIADKILIETGKTGGGYLLDYMFGEWFGEAALNALDTPLFDIDDIKGL